MPCKRGNATHEDSTARSSEQVKSLTIENECLLKKVESLKSQDDLFLVDNLFSLGDEVILFDPGTSTLNSLPSHISSILYLSLFL